MKDIFKAGLGLISVVMLVGTGLSVCFPTGLFGLFTDSQETVALGREALLIISRGFLISGISVAVTGVLEGLGKGMESLMISLARYIAVILPLAFLLSQMMGAAGVWNAFWVTEVIAAVLAAVLIGRVMRRELKQRVEQ